MLARACPRSWVDATLARAGLDGQRQRSLPPWVVVYLVMALALWPDVPTASLLQRVCEGFSRLAGGSVLALPASKSAISQARARLGHACLQQMAQELMLQHATRGRAGSNWNGRRLCVLRSFLVGMPDTPANARHFGRTGHGPAPAIPTARLLVLQQAASGQLLDAMAAPGAEKLHPQDVPLPAPLLDAGNLVFVGGELEDPGLLRTALRGAAAVVWQIRARQRPAIDQLLADGSYLGSLPATAQAPPLPVRVIGYTLQAEGEHPRDATFLVTNLLQVAQAPALALVELHRQAVLPTAGGPVQAGPQGTWADEVLTGAALRSKDPALALQELWGRVLALLSLQHHCLDTFPRS